MTITGREFRLAARPVGVPRPEDFELAEVPVPELAPGQILVRNQRLSVDPYMRGRMSEAKSYAELFTSRSSFRRLFLCCAIQASVQMTGVSAIQ